MREKMKLSRRMARLAMLLLMGLFGAFTATAQLSHGGMPCPERMLQPALRSATPLPFVEMPAVDTDSLLREDSLSAFSAQRFAHKFYVDMDMENSGVVTILPDGTKVWRVGITSKGAFSLNLLLADFEIPSQARLFLYSPDKSVILGAFTAENRQRSGVLPIAPIEGDSLIVEYVEPAESDFAGRLRIAEVNHDYVGFRLLPSTMASKSCEVDVNCDELSKLPQKRSVCLITISGAYYCSGALVNNTAEDDAPYVLTASHCLFADGSNPPVDERLAETCVFFFNYETPYCYSEIKGTMEQTVAGATVAVSNHKYDMLLLRLNDSVPLDYRPYFSGWNVSDEIRPPFYMIHHPAGDLKKISLEKDLVHTASFYTLHFLANSHWRVDLWEQGISEGGSSGSPLFDAGNRIIGALSGGNTRISCTQRGDDNFYKLSLPWKSPQIDSLRISPWLDPLASGVLRLDGKEPKGVPCVRLTNIRPSDQLLPQAEGRQGFAAGHNDLGYLRYAERFEAEGLSKIYGIYFVPFSGAFSEEQPIKVSIYSGEQEPTTLLHEQTLRIMNTTYSETAQKFNTQLAHSWLQKENYLRLDSAVSVEGNFFVVFDLPENPDHKFALRHTGERWSDDNSALFFHGGAWHTFRENALVRRGTSLMVDVVCQCSVDSSQPEEERRQKTLVAVGEDDAVYLFFETAKGKKQIQVYDMCGRLMSEEASESDCCRVDAPRGVSLIRVVYNDYTETLKMVR